MKTIKGILSEVGMVNTPFEKKVRAIHTIKTTEVRGRGGEATWKSAKKDHSKLAKDANPGQAMSESAEDVKYRYMSSVDEVLNEIGDLWSAYSGEELNAGYYKTLLRRLEDIRDDIETSLGVKLEPVAVATSTPPVYDDETESASVGYGDWGISENFRQGPWKFKNGEEIKMTKEEVDLLNGLRGKLHKDNANHLEEKAGKSLKSFNELIDYARLVTKEED